MWNTCTIGGPPRACYNRSRLVFDDRFQTVVVPWCRRNESPKVVIVDNIPSFFSPDIKICEDESVQFICLVPISTQLTQPRISHNEGAPPLCSQIFLIPPPPPQPPCSIFPTGGMGGESPPLLAENVIIPPPTRKNPPPPQQTPPPPNFCSRSPPKIHPPH